MVSSRMATPWGNCSVSFHGVSARLLYMSPAHDSFKAYLLWITVRQQGEFRVTRVLAKES